MKEKGQSLIEIVIALGLFVIIAGGIMTLALGALISERQGGEITQATLYSQEGSEATQSIRDQAWNKLAYYDDGATHGLDNSSGIWDIAGFDNSWKKFTRTVEVNEVTRDASGNIGAGVNDIETKEIVVNTDWSFALGRSNQVAQTFYLTNWNRGLWTQTTEAEFNTGTTNNTQVTNDSGGEVKLAAGGGGGDTYGNSFLVESTGGINAMNNANKWTSIRFTAQNTKTVEALRVYLDREQGNSPTYRYGLQADSGGDPSGTWLGGTNNGYGDLKATSDEWQTVSLNETVDLTQGTTYHLIIQHQSGQINNGKYIDIRQSSPRNQRIPYNNTTDSNSNVIWTDNSGSSWVAQDTQPIYVLEYNDATFEGNPYYQNTEINIYSTFYQGEIFTLSGGNKTVSSVGFYVKQKTNAEPQADIIVTLHDVTNDVQLASKILATPADVTPAFAWHEVNFDSPIALTDGDQYRIYIHSSGTAIGQDYQIFTLANTNDASDNGINYLATNSTYSFSNNSGTNWTDNNNQDVAFRFPPSAGGYQLSGTYESSDFGPQANYNLLKWTQTLPGPAYDFKVQIKTAPDSGGSPGAWSPTWCGPEGEDGDETDYFTDPNGEIINPDHIGDNWIKYKLTLTGDGANTPVLEDITVNYKPL